MCSGRSKKLGVHNDPLTKIKLENRGPKRSQMDFSESRTLELASSIPGGYVKPLVPCTGDSCVCKWQSVVQG